MIVCYYLSIFFHVPAFVQFPSPFFLSFPLLTPSFSFSDVEVSAQLQYGRHA